MNVVFVVTGFPGVARVGEEGEKLGWWKLHRVGEENPPPADAVIFGWWSPVYERYMETYKNARICVLVTSSPGEMDLERSEMPILVKLLNDRRIHAIWAGHPGFSECHPKMFYAPYPMSLEGYTHGPKVPIITLFSPGTLKKNIVNQFIAARDLCIRNKLTLHTNVTPPTGLVSIIGAFPIVWYSWVPRETLYGAMRASQLNLAVSWAETHSYNAAEAILLGTPNVGSETIPFLPRSVCVSDPNNPGSIVSRAEAILRGERTLLEQEDALRSYAAHANRHLAQTILPKLT